MVFESLNCAEKLELCDCDYPSIGTVGCEDCLGVVLYIPSLDGSPTVDGLSSAADETMVLVAIDPFQLPLADPPHE